MMDLPDRQLLDAAPDAMVVVNASGEIVLVNCQTEALFGYSRDELFGQPIEVLMPDRFRNRHSQHRTQFVDHPRIRAVGQKLDVELIGRRKDGTEFQAEISLSPVESDQGFFVASAIRDITVRLLEDKKLKQLLDSSADAMVVVDPAGTMVLVNTQTESLFGYRRAELLGNAVEMLLPERFRARHPHHLETFFGAPRVRAMGAGLELYGRRKNGDEFPIEISLSPVETAQGPLVSSAIRDVTAHKDTERILEVAKEIAESATATKSRFLAAASHDLRQPLQSVGLYLSVLNRKLERSEERDICDKIRNSLDVMAELLDALLDISKLDSGSIVPTKKDFSTQVLFDQLMADNEPHASEKGLTFRCVGTPCVLHSDPALLQRIIENFVSNAIRYTQSGSVEVHCKTSGDHARIEIRDSGAGIPKESLESIFEEYFQLDNPVRDRRKGLGLGLSIVKHIARLLDHPLDVASVPGEGSTFAVEVPLGRSIEKHAQDQIPEKQSVQRDRPAIVLFVDDDPAIIDATTMLLHVSGFTVYSALSGDDALAHLASGIRPDIVVSDYRLPGYNGVEVVRRVRHQTVDELPAVLMTGDTSAQEIESANLVNCTVLHKPVDTDQMISLIQSLTA